MDKATLTDANATLTEQNLRLQVALDASNRRRGELRETLTGLIDAIKANDAAAMLADADALCKENHPDGTRFTLVSNLVDAAIATASGDDAAQAAMLAAATALRDFTACAIAAGRQTVVSFGETKSTKVVYTEAQVINAMQQVANKLGRSPSIAEFNATCQSMRHSDAIATFGKWSTAQAAAGLTVTKRGRKPKSQVATN